MFCSNCGERLTSDAKNKIIITLETDNAAFEDDPNREVAKILKNLANAFDRGNVDDNWSLRDTNGNKVGKVKMK